MQRYNQITEIIGFSKPKTVLEIGTHKATRPREWYAAHKFDHYYGFDVFEGGDEELDEKEMNGKGRCTQELAEKNLGDIPNTLYKGLTTDTLKDFDEEVEFAFIDGGHSVETIQHDFEKVSQILKPGGVIILDDYYTPEVEGFGCNRVVENITHGLLSVSDNGISLVMLIKAEVQ